MHGREFVPRGAIDGVIRMHGVCRSDLDGEAAGTSTVIVVPNPGLPLHEYCAKTLSVGLAQRRPRHRMDEDVTHTRIEHASRNAVLAENERGQFQSEQNPRLQMVPRARERNRGGRWFLLGCASFPGASLCAEMLKPKNHTTGAMRCENENFSERKVGWVVRAAECPRLDSETRQFLENELT